jgi:AcrR family transcriptional regulator
MAMASEPDVPPGVSPRRRRGRSVRQDQESAENRKAIVRHAVEFFARYGYAETTLQAVAEQAGLTRAGLLHHFHSKEGLFVEAIEVGRHWADHQVRHSAAAAEGLAGIRELRKFLSDTDDVMQVRFVQMLQGEALHDDAPEHLLRYVRLRLAKVHAQVSQYLQEARNKGEIGDVDIPALATMITATINGLQSQWLLDGSVDTGAALDALVELLACTAHPAAERDSLSAIRPPGEANSREQPSG